MLDDVESGTVAVSATSQSGSSAFDAFYEGVDRWMVAERERAVEALARAINECSFGTVKWDPAPDGYQEMRRIGARVILAELNERGWKLVR